MLYKIIDTIFRIENQQLIINNESIDIKKATREALILFLQSNGNIVTKDDLLNHIWKDVIVSDASAFKQVQLVKKFFLKVGLPKDTIENIYGRGYKIKYTIEKLIENPTTTQTTTAHNTKSSKKKYYYALISLALIAIILFVYSNSNNNANFLSLDKRESMVSLMNNDWEKGLGQINNILEQDQNRLSRNDFAFLYWKKGLSQYHLQNYKKSIKTYHHALEVYEQLNNVEQIGWINLNIAKSHARLPSTGDYYEKQQRHINIAITSFEKGGHHIKMIDAQMALAHLYNKNGKTQDSINLYEKTISDAKHIGDKAGELIANNNLAAVYLTLNNYDKALELEQHGLKMALEIGKGRYIASSYSFLSDLYQNQYKSTLAMEMIEQAIKYQLSNNEYTNLGPKLITLNFLLVQTYQFNKALELLDLSLEYANSMELDSGISIIPLYKGINAARMGDWKNASMHLTQGLEASQRANFKYKQPLNMAYLALSHYFNNNYLQAIEPAMTVINNTDSSPQHKAIASLALAYTYRLMEKNELADKWYAETQNLQSHKWLFEYQLFLKLKLERQQQTRSILISQTESEIEEVSKKMLDLTESAQVDEKIYTDLKLQISKKIKLKKEQKHSP